jgi:hypothetical protein
VDTYHTLVAKIFEKEVNFSLKGRKKRQPIKKRAIVSSGSISKNILSKIHSKKRMCHK